MTIFLIKIIASISMLIDHINDLGLFGHSEIGTVFGRIAFPFYAFLISEGYVHTKNIKKYILRVFIIALVSQLPFMLLYHVCGYAFKLNILFGFTLALLAVLIFDKIKNKTVGFLIVLMLCYLSYLIRIEYTFFSIILVMIFFIFRNTPDYRLLFTFILFALYFLHLGVYEIKSYVLYLLFSMIPILCITLFYKGRKGKVNKLFFYLFYPVHILILGILGLIFL